MKDKEIILPYDEIASPQTITERNIRAFREAGLDIHRHEVTELTDDHDRGVRRLKVRAVKFFGPWSRRGG